MKKFIPFILTFAISSFVGYRIRGCSIKKKRKELNKINDNIHELERELEVYAKLDPIDAFFIEGYKKGYFEEVGFF